jgi:hypothetical protein
MNDRARDRAQTLIDRVIEDAKNMHSDLNSMSDSCVQLAWGDLQDSIVAINTHMENEDVE